MSVARTGDKDALAEHTQTSVEWGVLRPTGFVVQTERWRDQVDWLTEHAARGLAQDEGGEVVQRVTTKVVHRSEWTRLTPPAEPGADR